ncbi:putative disease resistance protein RGA3 [Telopea speciosissima]|uniref:putative disease resistance protein RGA3 n=1 Tax=Telopea speciosissima TaxID=54955 RepID=UPI001CC592C9|nr:putative disease resistance protein RGA3 [Telopea speciosissima]
MVDSVLGVVLQNIDSLLQQEFALIWGVDREMRRLSETLDTIRDVLEDAEVNQFKDKAIKSWLKKLKDAAYDADDILDECAAKAIQLDEEAQMSNCTSQVSHSFLSCFSSQQLLFRRHKIGQRMKDIRERFDDIAAERSKFHLNQLGTVGWTIYESSTERAETSPILTTEHPVYGREEDREVIVKVLLEYSSKPDLLVYPIFGMGGLGKTTLAQLVYNDERVKSHFETRNWVCVSDDFDVKRLTKAIIESMGGTANDLTELHPMQSRLREMLSKRRSFLIVLDDVWNEDQDKWATVKSSLTCGSEGSAILVTTRIEKIALIMGTFSGRHLKRLSEDNCWDLFKQRAFRDGREEKSNLVVIGKEIVKKCGGVPLAAKSLGGLMRFKHTEIEWVFVRDSEIWDLPEDEENTILPALRLSYNHPPSHLRQCFAYCSIFPKDHEIKKEMLVHLWMANGFIPSRGNMELEDIGYKIFNELLWRSFFQDIEKNDYGDVVHCKMHDLVHDLACSVMGDECWTLDDDATSKEKIVPKGIRHLSMKIHQHSNESFLRKSQTIRTLLLDVLPVEFNISNLRYLRVLHLSNSSAINVDTSNRPSPLASLAYLIHLRYLDLSKMNIRTLPESLSNLKHLQTLNLFGCFSLQNLPAQMSNMSSLRHLDIRGCNSLSYVPSGMGRLIHLQTLSIFIVRKKSGCGISELQGLNNLRGEVHIKGLEKVKNSVDAKEANLIGKRNLDSLALSWSHPIHYIDHHHHHHHHHHETHIIQAEIASSSEEVLEVLQPPASIRRLVIENYMGMKFPSWMDGFSLQNLVYVELSNCDRCEHLTHFVDDSVDGLGKGFLLLKELVLRDMLSLEELLLNVPEGREVFPSLVKMKIINCDKLKTLPLIPSLQTVSFENCSKLITLPRMCIRQGEIGFSSLKEFYIRGCKAMKFLWDEEDETQFQGLSSLKKLRIRGCTGLASLSSGLRYLTALERLSIEECPELELSQLEDFRHLTSLQEIYIFDLPMLTSLPESLKYATMLQRLQISGCWGLNALPEWIQNLTSLRNISIWLCPNLTFLPDGLQQMTALQNLVIEDCNTILETRCREGGEDWHKIVHIPNVIVKSSISTI